MNRPTFGGLLRGLNRDVGLWLFAWFASVGFSFFGIFGVVFNLYAVRLGFDSGDIGLLHSLMTLSLAISSLPAGLLGSRYGGRKWMIIGLAGMGTAYAVFATAGTVPPRLRFTVLVVGVILSGGAAGLYLVNAIPVFTGHTQPDRRPVAFALFAAMEPAGGFVGSVVAGAVPGALAAGFGWSLSDPLPYRFTLLIPVVAVGAALAAVVAMRSPASTAPSATVESAPRADKNESPKGNRFPLTIFLVISAVAATRMPATMFPRAFFNVYSEGVLGMNVSGIGAALGIAQLAMVPIILLVPYLTARLGKESTFIGGVFLAAAGAVALALIPRVGAAVGALLLVNIGFALHNTVFNQYQQEVVEPRYRAPISGAVVLAQAAGISAVNFTGGRSIPRIGFDGAFLIAAGTAVAAGLIFGGYFVGVRNRGGTKHR